MAEPKYTRLGHQAILAGLLFASLGLVFLVNYSFWLALIFAPLLVTLTHIAGWMSACSTYEVEQTKGE